VRAAYRSVFPASAVDVAHDCKTFFARSKSKSREHADKPAWGFAGTESPLRSWLPRMIEAGCCCRQRSCIAVWSRSGSGTASAPIGAIGFPTAGIALISSRARCEFRGQCSAVGRSVVFLVADSSAARGLGGEGVVGVGWLVGGARAAIFRRVCVLWRAKHEVRCFTRARKPKRALASGLVRGLSGAGGGVICVVFDPLGTGFACGATRNSLLLTSAAGCFFAASTTM